MNLYYIIRIETILIFVHLKPQLIMKSKVIFVRKCVHKIVINRIIQLFLKTLFEIIY